MVNLFFVFFVCFCSKTEFELKHAKATKKYADWRFLYPQMDGNAE